MAARELRIGEASTTDQGRTAEVEFRLGEGRYPVYFRSNGVPLAAGLDSLLACALLPAMKEAEILIADGEAGSEASGGVGGEAGRGVSARLLSSLSTIQDVFHDWEPSLRRIEIRNAIPVERALPREARVGTFFTGGVDSYYTLLKHRDEITDLIFVRGFDMSIASASLYQRTSSMIREVGAFFGKRVVEIETNLRSFIDPYANWMITAHGAALAAVGHLLSAEFRRIYIPASHTYSRLVPWGSHPLLDPLWSSEALEFVHDGCEVTRVDKIPLIADHEIVLRTLRVCFVNPGEAYNCGRCEKCVRTMLSLRAFGVLDRATTFDAPLDVRNVLKIQIRPELKRAGVTDNLRALERRGDAEEYCRALRRVLNRPRWPAELKERLRDAAMRHPASSRMYEALKGARRAYGRPTER